MARAPTWLRRDQLEARCAVLEGAARALEAMEALARGREPLSGAMEPTPALMMATYEVAQATVRAASGTLHPLLFRSWQEGAVPLALEWPLETYSSFNRVPELRRRGFEAYKRTTGQGR